MDEPTPVDAATSIDNPRPAVTILGTERLEQSRRSISPDEGAALAPIAGNASLVEALAEYFRCGGETQRTARQLGLRSNSVRYRLKRASTLLDRDLSSPDDLAELSLSMRLLGQRGESPNLPLSISSL